MKTEKRKGRKREKRHDSEFPRKKQFHLPQILNSPLLTAYTVGPSSGLYMPLQVASADLAMLIPSAAAAGRVGLAGANEKQRRRDSSDESEDEEEASSEWCRCLDAPPPPPPCSLRRTRPSRKRWGPSRQTARHSSSSAEMKKNT